MRQYNKYLSSKNRKARQSIMQNIGGRWLQWKEKYTQNITKEQRW